VSHQHVQQLGAIRNEYVAARAAIAYVIANWGVVHDAGEIEGNDLKHFRAVAVKIEATYIIRLFSSYEGVLHGYLQTHRRRTPRTAETLINRVSTHANLPDPLRDGAHEVRVYRNSLVHPGPSAAPLTFQDALSRLNRFLAPL
jgi:hypothetical protein